MIRRLMEQHYFQFHQEPTPERVRFWLLELRTPELLQEICRRFPSSREATLALRPLLAGATGSVETLEKTLQGDEWAERERDRAYWKPLRRELETVRRKKRQNTTLQERQERE